MIWPAIPLLRQTKYSGLVGEFQPMRDFVSKHKVDNTQKMTPEVDEFPSQTPPSYVRTQVCVRAHTHVHTPVHSQAHTQKDSQIPHRLAGKFNL